MMKEKSNHPQILIIRSPFSLPGVSSRCGSHLLSQLQSTIPNLKIFDAAMDFVNKVLVTIEKDKKNITGLIKAETTATTQIDLEPVSLIEDLKTLDRLLHLLSDAYPSAKFHRYGFAHPELNQVSDVKRFVDDVKGNPFRNYAFNLWQPFNDSAPPDVALLYADAPGQLGPAMTLTSAWKIRWSHIPIQWVGPAFANKTLKTKLAALFSQHSTGMNTASEAIQKMVDQSITLVANFDEEDKCCSDGFGAYAIQPLIPKQMPKIIASVLKTKCRFISWKSGDGNFEETTRQLYAASRQGIWNHLIFEKPWASALEQFASANANIVHSYCYRQTPLSNFSDPMTYFPTASPSYGRTHQMPGRPLWMMIANPILIHTCLARYDIKQMMRMRVRHHGDSMFEVGKNLSYQFQPPSDLPDGYLDEIVRMVEAGGSVNTQFVRHNLERAYMVAYAEEEGVIVGNSSLKHPRKEYIDAVSDQSGIDLHQFLERGYTSVRPEYRGLGIGAKLLEGLTERAGAYKIFSVIAENNLATQKMAIRNRTRRVATFFSQRAKKKMSVWIPEWMLPKGIQLPEQPDPDKINNSKKAPL